MNQKNEQVFVLNEVSTTCKLTTMAKDHRNGTETDFSEQTYCFDISLFSTAQRHWNLINREGSMTADFLLAFIVQAARFTRFKLLVTTVEITVVFCLTLLFFLFFNLSGWLGG